MCMIDGCDEWTFTHYKTVKARKYHQCDECLRMISPGEKYELFKGLMDRDHWSVYRTCEHCQAARSWLVETCRGWLFRGVLDELAEHWEEDPSYRSIWLGRAILTMRRGHKRRDGTLRPPMDDFKPAGAAGH